MRLLDGAVSDTEEWRFSVVFLADRRIGINKCVDPYRVARNACGALDLGLGRPGPLSRVQMVVCKCSFKTFTPVIPSTVRG